MLQHLFGCQGAAIELTYDSLIDQHSLFSQVGAHFFIIIFWGLLKNVVFVTYKTCIGIVFQYFIKNRLLTVSFTVYTHKTLTPNP